MATYGQRIKDLAPSKSLVLEKVPLGGSLEARKLPSGDVRFYWRHTAGKVTHREPIGTYDPAAPPKSHRPTTRGYSVQAALERARELAIADADSPGGLRAAREREAAAEVAEAASRLARERFTLAALCTEYCDFLKAKEKSAWADARNIFDNHLVGAFPLVANKPANEVEKSEIVIAVRRLTEAGKMTTARKLRAYTRAAFACAMKADSDATLPAGFISYQVRVNPVEGTSAIRTGADKNPLTADELRAYWRALIAEDSVRAAALRIHVLAGGQRVQQLLRLKAPNDVAGSAMQLLDAKGRRSEARVHLVPITQRIRGELGKLPAKGFVFSTDSGKTPIHATSMSVWAREIAAAAGIENYQLKRVRSGIETLLAEAGVTPHLRGQLQSHGIGGVQAKHYDAYDYLLEKRDVLEQLERLLDAKPGPAKSARKRASA
jgi:integrase